VLIRRVLRSLGQCSHDLILEMGDVGLSLHLRVGLGGELDERAGEVHPGVQVAVVEPAGFVHLCRRHGDDPAARQAVRWVDRSSHTPIVW
jgi:hypothetical protein